MSSPILRVDRLEKTFSSSGRSLSVLEEVSFDLAEGETMAITGPSGSGKSTLLGLLAGLDRPSSGKVLFEGKSLGDWNEDQVSAWRRSSIGFIFQNFRLIPSLTARENVALPLEILGRSKDEAEKESSRLLESLGVGGRGGHFPSEMSGGEQQRVAIARAYAHHPRLIFADEPTGSLDRETAGRVLESLLTFNSERKAALIVVTHDEGVAQRLGRRVSLEAGRLSE